MPLSPTLYPVLDPASTLDTATAATRATQCALAVMAKAPRPGKVKTRLSPPLTLDQAAALNVCFLQDTAQNLAQVATSGAAAGLISYTPIGDEALFNGLLPEDFALIPQRGDGFGERLFHTAQDILRCGYGAVCLIDSDSPTVPTSAYRQAIETLAQPGDRIVLGPSHDGGYYLIGLKQAHSEPFANITWSTAAVAAETRVRCAQARIEVVELPLWYDVDDAPTLELLTAELLDHTPPSLASTAGYPAPHTHAKLLELQPRRPA
jgi:rSAM/selenodomain-associated transferase 1